VSRLSIVIPVLDEAPNLEALLPGLEVTCPGAEVVVVDGGSADSSREVVERCRWARLVASPRGRSAPDERGAAAAR
jgi:hypothetical protein